MKKIISLCLSVLCLLSILSVEVSANTLEDTVPNYRFSTILLDTGETIKVKGTLVEDSIQAYNANSEYSATYEYILDSQTLESITRVSHSDEASDEDPTLSVRAYLTLRYEKEPGSGSSDYYLLTGVSGRWEILDITVGVTSAKLSYQLVGVNAYGGRPVDVKVTDMSVNNNFSQNTGFTDYIVGDGFGTLMASLTLNMKMGNTRTWSWTFDNQLL